MPVVVTLYVHDVCGVCLCSSVFVSVCLSTCYVCLLSNYAVSVCLSVCLPTIAPLQVHYTEALPTHHGYCVGVSRRNATGNFK